MNQNRIMVPLKSPRNYVNQEKSSPNVLLVNITDCGAACIATICKQNGYKISITRIREVAGTDKQGTNVYGVIKAAEHFGFSAKGVKGNKEAFFSEFPLPCIAHVIVAQVERNGAPLQSETVFSL